MLILLIFEEVTFVLFPPQGNRNDSGKKNENVKVSKLVDAVSGSTLLECGDVRKSTLKVRDKVAFSNPSISSQSKT